MLPAPKRDYAWNIQQKSVTVHFDNGDDFVWPENHPNLEQVREAIKTGAPGGVLRKLMDMVSTIRDALAASAAGALGITVTRNGVFYNGQEIHMTVTERILQHAGEGYPVEPLVRFLGKLLGGNSHRDAVLSLYDFLEANNIPITEDGDFIVYKKVRDDYRDIHSGTFDNTVGSKPRIPAWEVEADRTKTCAKGLHVCSREYLPHFGSEDSSRVMICKVNPADVIAVPPDYKNSKMRVCAYEVIGELTDKQKADIFDNVKIVRSQDFKDDSIITWGDWDRDDDEAQDPYAEEYDDGFYDPNYDDPDDDADLQDPDMGITDEDDARLVSNTVSCGDKNCPVCGADEPKDASSSSRPWLNRG